MQSCFVCAFHFLGVPFPGSTNHASPSPTFCLQCVSILAVSVRRVAWLRAVCCLGASVTASLSSSKDGCRVGSVPCLSNFVERVLGESFVPSLKPQTLFTTLWAPPLNAVLTATFLDVSDEVQTVIDCHTKGKASDNNGIRAEDIKTSDETTKEMIRQIFNEVIKQEDCTLETWKRIRIKVIYNRGNVEEVGSYRPICTLPALYTLFSTVIYNRVYDRLDRAQLEDQGGFRRSYQTLDHLATYKTA